MSTQGTTLHEAIIQTRQIEAGALVHLLAKQDTATRMVWRYLEAVADPDSSADMLDRMRWSCGSQQRAADGAKAAYRALQAHTANLEALYCEASGLAQPPR